METLTPINPGEKKSSGLREKNPAAAKRLEMLRKSAEENLEYVAETSQDVINIEAEEERLRANSKRAKNEEEKARIYARMAELVKEKKALKKKLSEASKNAEENKESKEENEIAVNLPEIKSALDSKKLIQKINKLFQSEGAGPEGRQRKIEFLREMYGDDFVKNNITETGIKGTQKDIVNNILQQSVNHIEKSGFQKQRNEDTKRNKEYLDRINKLFQSEGAGTEGRQKKIELLREIYGDDFVKNNIAETGEKGFQKDIVNDLLQKAVGEIVGKIQSLSSPDESGTGSKKFQSEESRKIIEELKSLKKRAKELEGPESNKKDGGEKSEIPGEEKYDRMKEENEMIEKAWEDKLAGKEAKTKEQKREDLLKVLEEARIAYATQDYKTNNAWRKIKSIFKKELRVNPDDDNDVGERRKDYEKALAEWKQFRIEEVKEKYQKMTPDELAASKPQMDKEMGELVREFGLDQKLNLYQARTDAMTKEREGKWLGRTVEGGKKIVDWYRKLPMKYKLGLAAVLFVGGGGLAAAATFAGIGTASLGFLGTNLFANSTVATGALFGFRTLGGAASGVGATALKESLRRKREAGKQEKDIRKTLESLDDIEDLDKKFDAIDNKLTVELDKYDSSYQTEIKKSRRDKYLGVCVALLPAFARYYLSSGAGGGRSYSPYATAGAEFERPGGNYYEAQQPGGIKQGVPNQGVGGGKETIGGGGKYFDPSNPYETMGNEKPGGATVPGAERMSKIIQVPKGSSFEKALIENLKAQGINPKEAGGMAHRMMLEYAKNHPDPSGRSYDLVHPNAKLMLSPDGKHVIGFQDSQAGSGKGFVPEKGSAKPKIRIEAKIPTGVESFDFSQIDNQLEGIQDIQSRAKEILARNPNLDKFDLAKTEARLDRITNQIKYHQQSIDVGVEYAGGMKPSGGNSLKDHMKYLMGIREDLTQQVQDYKDINQLRGLYAEKWKNMFGRVSEMIVSESGSGQTFDNLSGVSASQFIEQHPGGKFGSFYHDCEKIIGSKAVKPLAGEDIQAWTHRVTGQIIRARAAK